MLRATMNIDKPHTSIFEISRVFRENCEKLKIVKWSSQRASFLIQNSDLYEKRYKNKPHIGFET